ncbi:glycerol-3-phosphate dehydrogenase [Caballeronia sp. LZ016]|uniref:glycerol-3-phosphate dehydrogenase n=1 Tax=Caballeronia sp. LZ016 TaxID=3038554 RepID=UPI0028615A71|nr:glycerol-3-phosphate dehydrogenase [Caballeronia sp. LZ016]MDR5741452.1 glycerol-3-phosphate dehydrogenase [Caballeronia sp. LZ016]
MAERGAHVDFDVLVVGGGINGAGIARDLSGRGVRVMLVERDDLAQHTSSASTKLIHGGLRYLEYGEFGLVRKALREREVLLSVAPHLIAPLRFVMPHVPALRPAWMIRAGLFLYDHLSRRAVLEGSRSVNLRRHVAGAPLVDSITRGFIYSDAAVDDARLVVLNALGAHERGARIATRTRFVSASRGEDEWRVLIADAAGHQREISARALVNAAGPWVNALAAGDNGTRAMRLVKGSHIVTRKLFDHDHAYILQNDDRRIIFAIPWQRGYTLIGTTDVDYEGPLADVRIAPEEIDYLCAAVNRYFRKPVAASDVVWSYAGVRPLLADGADNAASATRDYELQLDTTRAPLLTIFGGKITTYRRLAEEAVEQLAGPLAITVPAWTHAAPLPGGEMPDADFARFLHGFEQRYPFLPRELATRYARAYGTRADVMLDGIGSMQALGARLAPDLYEAEARYLVDHEWAHTADDILWRRTKLGLEASAADIGTLEAWLSARRRGHAPFAPLSA